MVETFLTLYFVNKIIHDIFLINYSIERYTTKLEHSEYAALGYAVSGECGGACYQIYAFIAIFAAVMFVHATGEVGAVLLIIRCTDKNGMYFSLILFLVDVVFRS